MQVSPIAVSTRVQMVKTSNEVRKLYRTGCAAGSTKYPGLVAIGFWKVKESGLARAARERLANNAFRIAGRLANTTSAKTVLYFTSALQPNLTVAKSMAATTAWNASTITKKKYEIHLVPIVRPRI